LGEIRLSVPEEAAEEAEGILREHQNAGPISVPPAEKVSCGGDEDE
jgi:hypothetical protein